MNSETDGLFASQADLDNFVAETKKSATVFTDVEENFARARSPYLRLLHPQSKLVDAGAGKAGDLWHTATERVVERPVCFVSLHLTQRRLYFADNAIKCQTRGSTCTREAVRDGATIPCPGAQCEFALWVEGVGRRCTEMLSVSAWLPDLDKDGERAIAVIDFRGGSLPTGRKLVAALKAAGDEPYMSALRVTSEKVKSKRGATFWQLVLAPWDETGGLIRPIHEDLRAELTELAAHVTEHV